MKVHTWTQQLAAAAVDLALGGVCAGCAGSAGLLCAACRGELAQPARLMASRPGGLRVVALSAYGGPVRSMVLSHKERGRLGLAEPLGDALAAAVVGLLETPGGCADCGRRPVVLVPAPSARTAVRQRGHDPLLRIARRAGVVLRRTGRECSVVPALRHSRRVSDQAGLRQGARMANLHEAMTLRGGSAPLLADRCAAIVDDVMTTGATLGEAARALRAAGMEPCGAAVIAVAP